MKPNELIDGMEKAAKVDTAPKPSTPKPEIPKNKKWTRDDIPDVGDGKTANDCDNQLMKKHGWDVLPVGSEKMSEKEIVDAQKSKPKMTTREKWDRYNKIGYTGDPKDIDESNQLMIEIEEELMPYMSDEEHEKWADMGATWTGEPEWLDKTEEYLKRVENGKKYKELSTGNPYAHTRRVARNPDQYFVLESDYEKEYEPKVKEYLGGLDKKRQDALKAAWDNVNFKKNSKYETLGEYIANNDLVNKYPKDEDYYKSIEPFTKELEGKYKLDPNEVKELADYYRRFPRPAMDKSLEDWEYLNYVQDLMDKGMSATQAYDEAEKNFERVRRSKKQSLFDERDALWSKFPNATKEDIQRLIELRNELGDDDFYEGKQ